jgi:serine phosphatase RsbU (regulator of sigma subunit)
VQDLLAAIMDGVRRFGSQEQQDDITAIVAKFKPGD